jgi:hypothetical protein
LIPSLLPRVRLGKDNHVASEAADRQDGILRISGQQRRLDLRDEGIALADVFCPFSVGAGYVFNVLHVSPL